MKRKYDSLIERLSPLMRFIDYRIGPLGPAKFNFVDKLLEKEQIEFGPTT